MGKKLFFFLKNPWQTLKPCNSVILTLFLLFGMQLWRPPTAVEDGHPAILTRDVSVNYFSSFSRVVVQVTESSPLKDECTTLLSKRRDKRTQRHRVKSKKI